MKKKVFYSEFGAKGDGVSNDFYAIKAAHAYANEIGADVFGDKDAIYYISKTAGESIHVKTNTDFQGASIIIDDRDISPEDPERGVSIFVLKNEHEPVTYDKNGAPVKILSEFCPFDINTKNLPFATGYPTMIVPVNEEKKVYKRLFSSTDGSDQRELIVIDEHGVIDPTTPVLIPYENVTKLIVYRIDDEPITFGNVKITTRANAAPREYTYYARNILINRSNVTIKNLEHYITDEGDTGAPYSGFISPVSINNLLVEDCILSGHKYYEETSGRSWMGTYDIGGFNSNKLHYKNCRQANFYKEDGTPDGTLWGIMGSNYCKNITYENCLLSRLDAHAGVYNASIIGSTVREIRLTGGGKFTLKDSTVYGNYLIFLREDYGCTWRGDMEIDNVKLINYNEKAYVLVARFFHNHNFGYQAYYPKNVRINKLSLDKAASLYIYTDPTPNESFDITAAKIEVGGETVDNVNQTIITESITIKDSFENIREIIASEDPVFNSQLKITLE